MVLPMYLQQNFSMSVKALRPGVLAICQPEATFWLVDPTLGVGDGEGVSRDGGDAPDLGVALVGSTLVGQ